MKTREKIWRKALEMFNARGIEQVGVREIARELGISPGNLSYHYPQKEDIIVELGKQLKALNDATLTAPEEESLTLREMLDQFHQAFLNQHQFRCLLISPVLVMQGNMRENYIPTARKRQATITRQIRALVSNGFLLADRTDQENTQNLVEVITVLARYWPSESQILFADRSFPEQLAHFLGVFARLFLPFATPKGKKQIHDFIRDLQREKAEV